MDALAAPLEASSGAGTEVTQVSLTVRQGVPLRCVFVSQTTSGAVAPLTNLRARFELGERGGAASLTYDTATPTSNLMLNPPLGEITLYLGARVTAALEPGAYQFDLDVYDPNDLDSVEQLAQGIVIVTPEVGS